MNEDESINICRSGHQSQKAARSSLRPHLTARNSRILCLHCALSCSEPKLSGLGAPKCQLGTKKRPNRRKTHSATRRSCTHGPACPTRHTPRASAVAPQCKHEHPLTSTHLPRVHNPPPHTPFSLLEQTSLRGLRVGGAGAAALILQLVHTEPSTSRRRRVPWLCL